MNIISKLFVCFIFIIGSHSLAISQEISVFSSFDQFEKSVIKENDTTYVINFWATWCKPCVQELPYFESFHKSIEGQKVKVLLVSLDFAKQLETHLKPFIVKNNYTAEIHLLADKNYNDWLHKISNEWSGSIPATLLVKGNKRLFAEREFESMDDLNVWISNFIKT